MVCLIAVATFAITYLLQLDNSASQATNDPALALRRLINFGEDRKFDEWGQLQPPRATRDLLAIRQRANEALDILQERVQSDDQTIRFNAYEILIDLTQLPAMRQRIQPILEQAKAQETDLGPSLRRLMAGQT